jgi:hypothetical protein
MEELGERSRDDGENGGHGRAVDAGEVKARQTGAPTRGIS